MNKLVALLVFAFVFAVTMWYGGLDEKDIRKKLKFRVPNIIYWAGLGILIGSILLTARDLLML